MLMPVSSLLIATTAAPYLRTERQRPLQPLLLAGHRVEQRLALVDRKAGFERLDDRRVDRQRQVGQDWTSWIVLARIAGSSASGIRR